MMRIKVSIQQDGGKPLLFFESGPLHIALSFDKKQWKGLKKALNEKHDDPTFLIDLDDGHITCFFSQKELEAFKNIVNTFEPKWKNET